MNQYKSLDPWIYTVLVIITVNVVIACVLGLLGKTILVLWSFLIGLVILILVLGLWFFASKLRDKIN